MIYWRNVSQGRLAGLTPSAARDGRQSSGMVAGGKRQAGRSRVPSRCDFRPPLPYFGDCVLIPRNLTRKALYCLNNIATAHEAAQLEIASRTVILRYLLFYLVSLFPATSNLRSMDLTKGSIAGSRFAPAAGGVPLGPAQSRVPTDGRPARVVQRARQRQHLRIRSGSPRELARGAARGGGKAAGDGDRSETADSGAGPGAGRPGTRARFDRGTGDILEVCSCNAWTADKRGLERIILCKLAGISN